MRTDNILLKKKQANLKRLHQAAANGASVIDALPRRLTIQNSLRCNLNCLMCQLHRDPRIARKANATRALLHFDVFRRVADETFPTAVEVLPTTMGEPLLTPYFDQFLKLLQKYQTKLNLTTNGMLMTPEISKQIIPILSDVKVSFDGATRETYEAIRRGGSYNRVIQNIKAFVQLRDMYVGLNKPTISFQVTLMRRNIRELSAIVELAHQLGVDWVKGYHVYVFDRQLEHESLWFHQDLSDRAIVEASEIAAQYGIKTHFPRPFRGSEPPQTSGNQCTFLWNESWIECNGDVAPCCVPDRPVMGNVFEESFGEIWNGEMYQQMRRGLVEGYPLDCCQHCSLRSEFADSGSSLPYRKEAFLLYDHPRAEFDPIQSRR